MGNGDMYVDPACYPLVKSRKAEEGGYWGYLGNIMICLFVVAGGACGVPFWKDPKDRNFIIAYIAIGVVAFIILVHRICTTDAIIKSKRFWPERIKIRNRNAAASAKWTPM